MTFITRAELRHDTVDARQFLRDQSGQTADGGHRIVWSLFGGDPAAPRDFLFRAMADSRYLVVSARPPAASASAQVWRIDTKPYAPNLSAGQCYGFALRVNPVLSLSQPGRARSARVDILMHEKKKLGRGLTPDEREDIVLDWLTPRMAALGAVIKPDECQLTGQGQIVTHRPGQKKKAKLAYVDIEGALTVDDPAHFHIALRQGIGHGKAFGLGLLLLRPLA